MSNIVTGCFKKRWRLWYGWAGTHNIGWDNGKGNKVTKEARFMRIYDDENQANAALAVIKSNTPVVFENGYIEAIYEPVSEIPVIELESK